MSMASQMPADRAPGSRGVRSLKVLVAEDIAVNSELVRLMLEQMGHEVDVVGDGEAAVAAARRGTHDVVLMDMQMPVMDGLAATRALRGIGGRFARLPIIGLSANVAPGQVASCRAAGMSDHVGKPFTSEIIAAALARHVPASASAGADGPTPADAPAAGVGLGDRRQQRVLLDLLDRQITLFERSAGEPPATLARQAHNLRGGAGLMGFDDLAEACRVLEAACGGVDPAVPLADALRACRAARRRIRRQMHERKDG